MKRSGNQIQMEELVSIIVPVYKVEKYLDRCIESIVNQTYSNFEIILVDDGSPDNCPAMCDAWSEKDDRIKVIHQENKGVSNARNAGMQLAKGKYVAFVDSDDWIKQNFVNDLYTQCEKENADISACGVCFVSECGEELEEYSDTSESRVCSAQDAFWDIMNGVGFRATPCNKLYRKKVLDGIMFPENKKHEDEFFANKVIHAAEKLVYTGDKLYYYLQQENSWMHTYSIGHLDALEAHLERVKLFETEYPSLYLADKARFCIACANNYSAALSGEIPEAKRAKEYIRMIRGEVNFTRHEFNALSIKEKVYVLATKGRLIELFCHLRNLRGRQR